jgi:tetratricopeptide (TPR) repeat protein
MICNHCGTDLGTQEYCANCKRYTLKPDHDEPIVPNPVALNVKNEEDNSFTTKIIRGVIALAFLGFGYYNTIDNEAIEKNNEALTHFDSGDSATAIAQFEEAAQMSTTDEGKLNALKNLAYVYATEGAYDTASSTFREALAFADEDSFDYYLVSGEIGLLEKNGDLASRNYNKAYEMKPDDFQINNALALFYLDLEGTTPGYADYPKALTHAQKAYAINNSEITKQNLALAYFFNESYDQTITLLSTTDLNNHPYAALWLGLAYVSKGDDANGRTYLQQAVNAGIAVPAEVYSYLESNGEIEYGYGEDDYGYEAMESYKYGY